MAGPRPGAPTMRQRFHRRQILAALAVVAGAVSVTASPAWAHVEIDPGSQPKGSTVEFAFRVPNEEDTASTVRVDVQFPTDHPIANVLVRQKPGGTFSTQTDKLHKPITTDDGTFSDAGTQGTWASSGVQISPAGYDVLAGIGGA